MPERALLIERTHKAAGGSTHPPQMHLTQPRITHSSGGAGVDLSHHQGNVDWRKIKQGGVEYAFIKTTEGNSFLDPRFLDNWQSARRAGVRRGAYHFFSPNDDPVRQADYFLASLGSDRGELAPVIDIESSGGGISKSDYTARVKAFLDRVESVTGKKPMIYTSARLWDQYTTRPAWAGQYPLWVAQYGASSPSLPAGWSKADYWQFSNKGKISGVAGNVDLDTMIGQTPMMQTHPAQMDVTTATLRTQPIVGAAKRPTPAIGGGGPTEVYKPQMDFRSQTLSPISAGAKEKSMPGREPGASSQAAGTVPPPADSINLVNTPLGPVGIPKDKLIRGSMFIAGGLIIGISIYALISKNVGVPVGKAAGDWLMFSVGQGKKAAAAARRGE